MSTPDDREWVVRAECRDAPTELFITLGDADDEPYYPNKDALAYCNRCPVKVECLQYAVDHDQEGIWGGTTAYQRRQLTRERVRAKCPSCGAGDLVFQNNIELCLSCGMSWRAL